MSAPAPTLRPERPGDHAQIEALHRQAFGSGREAAVVAGVRAGPRFAPDLALVAARGGEVLGHLLLSEIGVAWPSGEGSAGQGRAVLVLAPLAVRADAAGQGLGRALVRAGLEAAARTAYPLVVVRGAPGYYRALGARPLETLGLRPPAPLRVEEYSAWPLDPACPWTGGELRYPAAFAPVGYPLGWPLARG